ncbi:MAG: hypothetical protein AAB805_00895 [Patescibacteria group bacterium]
MSKHLETPERAKKWAKQMLLASLAIIPVGIGVNWMLTPPQKDNKDASATSWICAPDLPKCESMKILQKDQKLKMVQAENQNPVYWFGDWDKENKGWKGIAIQNKKMVAEFGVWEDGKILRGVTFAPPRGHPDSPRRMWEEEEFQIIRD